MNSTAGSGTLELYWLPACEDWKSRIAEVERLAPGDGDAWAKLVSLAGMRLGFMAEARLDRALLRLFGDAPPPGLATRPVRLAVLASSTIAHLLPSIRIAGLRRGLWVTVHEPDYGQYRQALANPSSGLHTFQPTAVLFALDARHLLARADPALDTAEADAALAETMADLRGLWAAARDSFRCQILQQTVLPIAPQLLGQNEQRLPGAPAAMAFAPQRHVPRGRAG